MIQVERPPDAFFRSYWVSLELVDVSPVVMLGEVLAVDVALAQGIWYTLSANLRSTPAGLLFAVPVQERTRDLAHAAT